MFTVKSMEWLRGVAENIAKGVLRIIPTTAVSWGTAHFAKSEIDKFLHDHHLHKDIMIKRLNFDLKDGKLVVVLDLEGESSSIEIEASGISIETEGDETFLIISEVSVSRPWLHTLAREVGGGVKERKVMFWAPLLRSVVVKAEVSKA